MNKNSFTAFPLYTSRIYRREIKTLTQLIIILLLGKAFLFSALFLIPITNAAPAPSLNSSAIIQLTNAQRTNYGIPKLYTSEKLTKAAEKKANDIIARGYFAHTTPDGKPFYQWVREENYAYKSAGENLAISFISNEDTVSAWMNSASHRENILDPHFTDIGIAVAIGAFEGKTTAVAVQMFGEPSYAKTSLTNATGAAPEIFTAKIQPMNEPGGARISPTVTTIHFLNQSATFALIVLFSLFVAFTLHGLVRYCAPIFKPKNVRSFPMESAIPQ